MNRYTVLTEGRELIALALAEFNLSEDALPSRWNNRLTSCMGKAKIRTDLAGVRTATLEFSPKIFERASQEERESTFVHEAAHGIVWLIHGEIYRGRRRDSHGPVWQQTMLRLGYQPDRCHSVDTTGLGRRTCKLSCRLCGADMGRCTPNKAEKLQRSLSLTFRCCGKQQGSVLLVERIR